MLSTSSTSGTSMSAADEEKRAAIMELKSKFDGNNNKLKQLANQQRHNETNLRRSAFTAAYLDNLPDDVPTYKSIGKAYFLEPKKSIMTNLEEIVSSADKELKSIQSIRQGLMTTQEGLAKELNEMIASLSLSK